MVIFFKRQFFFGALMIIFASSASAHITDAAGAGCGKGMAIPFQAWVICRR
jgi:hypothetical protein